MKKRIRNRKGFTLVEVLASITLFSVLVGVGITLFFNVNAQVNTSFNGNRDRSTLTQVVQNMTEVLSEATEVIITSNNELRYIIQNDTNTIGVFVYRNNQLARYRFDSGAPRYSATAVTNFRNPAITIISNPSFYTLQKTFVTNMTTIPVYTQTNFNALTQLYKTIHIKLQLPSHNPNGIQRAPLVTNNKYIADFEISLFTDH